MESGGSELYRRLHYCSPYHILPTLTLTEQMFQKRNPTRVPPRLRRGLKEVDASEEELSHDRLGAERFQNRAAKRSPPPLLKISRPSWSVVESVAPVQSVDIRTGISYLTGFNSTS